MSFRIRLSALTLVSHHLCPYVQRAAIAFSEKNVPFERIHVDLSNDPHRLRALSPLGKVPLLRVAQDGRDAVPVINPINPTLAVVSMGHSVRASNSRFMSF